MRKEEFGYDEYRAVYEITMEKAIKALPIWSRHKYNSTQHLTSNIVIIDEVPVKGRIVYDDYHRISILDEQDKFVFGWKWDFAGGSRYYSHFCGSEIGSHPTEYIS